MERVLSGRSTVVAAEGQVSCNVAEEAVVLDLESGVHCGLNSVAARVWNLIQRPRTVHEIQAAILDEYDVAPARCEHDLLALLRDLAARRLIDVEDEPGR
jgi:hypothetical protein